MHGSYALIDKVVTEYIILFEKEEEYVIHFYIWEIIIICTKLSTNHYIFMHMYVYMGTKSFFLDSRINFMQRTYPLFLPSSFQEQDTKYS